MRLGATVAAQAANNLGSRAFQRAATWLSSIAGTSRKSQLVNETHNQNSPHSIVMAWPSFELEDAHQ